jgi:hypothetical protein
MADLVIAGRLGRVGIGILFGGNTPGGGNDSFSCIPRIALDAEGPLVGESFSSSLLPLTGPRLCIRSAYSAVEDEVADMVVCVIVVEDVADEWT